MTFLLFILGFIFLIKGADMLVDGGTMVAKKFNISNIVIGLTIVAFGTSLPELLVNIMSIYNGSTELAIGNVLGSNIANILLILGVAAVIYPITTNKNTVLKEIPFSLLAGTTLFILANDFLINKEGVSVLNMGDGLILLSFFLIFTYYIFTISKDNNEVEKKVTEKIDIKKSIFLICAGLFGLVLGGKWIVDGAITISQAFGLSESLIGLTVIAVGTSLPELATSAVAAFKKNTDIAIGNVVGSNIFNIFFILGISALIKPLPFTESSIFDAFMVVVASLLLFAFMYVGKKQVIEKWQGYLMVVFYILYITFLVLTK